MTAAIIAGGRSRRMKREKAFLKLGGKALIERVLEVLCPLFPHVLINSNTPQRFQCWGVPVIPDIVPDRGPLGGIYTALVHAGTEYVFCVACDLPFLNPDLITVLQAEARNCDILVPRTSDGRHHPLHAVYSKNCLTTIKQRLQHNQLKISELFFFSQLTIHYLDQKQILPFDPDSKAFMNLNTPDDFRQACRMEQAVRKKFH